ncbi:MAG: response regulator transcription factor, partial [Gaiellaceae bacterium]
MNGQRILVVDDEPSIVDAVATALRYEGFEVDEATAGREALRAVAEREPDLVVLDWMLPDLEGIEVGRRMRERGFKSAILFLTAKDAVENKVEALRAGGDDYVTKPFSLAEIVARVQAILRRAQSDLPGDVLKFGDLVLDEQRHEVFRG